MSEVTGLSSVTDTESLRVSGPGNARLLVNRPRERFAVSSESDPIRNLRSQKRKLRPERDTRKAGIEILKGFCDKIGDKPDQDGLAGGEINAGLRTLCTVGERRPSGNRPRQRRVCTVDSSWNLISTALASNQNMS